MSWEVPERHHLRGSGIARTQNASTGAGDRAAGQERWPSAAGGAGSLFLMMYEHAVVL